MNKRFIKGVIEALLGGIFWGLSGACAQYLSMHYTISPLFVVLVRNTAAAILFAAILLIKHRPAFKEMLHDRSCWPHYFTFALVGILLCQTCYIFAIERTNAGTTTVIQSLNVVIVLAYICLRTRRLPYFFEWLGVILATVAIFLIATGGDFSTLVLPADGLIAGIMAAFAVAVYVLAPKKLFERWNSMPVVSVGLIISGMGIIIIWIIGVCLSSALPAIQPYFSIPELGFDGILALIIMFFFGTFAAFGLYLGGVAIVGGVNGSLLSTVEPVAATVFAVCFLGTSFAWSDWVGLVLMISTVFLVVLQPSGKRKKTDKTLRERSET